MLIIQNLSLLNGSVFIRCDFNVPIDDFGNILDDGRLKASLPTILYCLDHNCKIILASHLGRPKNKYDKKYSLLPVAKRLSRLLNKEILFSGDVIGDDTQKRVKTLKNADILLLENLRYEKAETKNDTAFAKKLASLAQYYVNDAFGVSHRAHASVEAITHFYDDTHKGAGFLLQKEIKFFQTLLRTPPHPFTLIVGGSKVSTKLEVLKHLLPELDKMIVGGAMALTFLKALGVETGNSSVEEDLLDEAKKLTELAKKNDVKLFFPVDFIVAKELKQETKSDIVTFLDIPQKHKAFDIGPATLLLFQEALKESKILFWNGPMGVFEIDKFSHGSLELARFVSTLQATKIIGGGDTAEMIHNAGVTKKMTFVSTGGGASLELLSGKELPGIKALS